MMLEHTHCTIKKVTYEDGSIEYVARGPFYPFVMGVGDTPAEALKELESATDAYTQYKEESENDA